MLKRIKRFIAKNKDYVRNPKNLKLFVKFLAALYLVSIISLSIGLISYFQGKNYLEKQALTFYDNLTTSKRNVIENYFQNIENKLRVNSHNPSVMEAITEFSDAFYAYNTEIDQKKRDMVIDFYDQKFRPKYKYATVYRDSLPNLETQLSKQSTTELHYHYLANNPNPIGFKYQLRKINTDSAYYHKVHAKYHPYFVALKENYGYRDIFLIDARGNLVYSVSKEIDFANNFLHGPFKTSSAASLYRDVIKNAKEGEVKLADYSFYPPSYDQPAMFVATPLFKKGKKIGVLMFQLSSRDIDNILSGNQSWKEEGLKGEGEVALIGPDFLIRNNTRNMQTNIVKYISDLTKAGEDSTVIKRIDRLKTTILLRKISSKVGVVNQGMEGKKGVNFDVDYRGSKVLDVYGPVDIIDKRWVIFTEITASEIFEDVNNFFFYLLLGFAIIFILITIIGYRLARDLASPIQKIKRDITLLSEGQLPNLKTFFYKDEIGEVRKAVNDLTLSIKEITNFAENIGKGNFDYHFEAKSKDDILGLALIDMKDNLQKVSEDEKIRSWINSGNAHFSEILRENNDDLESLGKEVVSELVKYVNALQAAIFLKDEDKDTLNILSTFAFDRHKYQTKEFRVGEGLVGQCFAEKESIYLLDIPKDYSPISSGLGKAQPKSVFLVPIINDENIFGVLELASFHVFSTVEKELIEELARDIATTIASIKRNLETQKLLDDTEERHQKQVDKVTFELIEKQKMLEKENLKLKEKIAKLGNGQ